MTLLEDKNGATRVVLVTGGIHRLVYTGGAITRTVASFEILNLASSQNTDVLGREPGELWVEDPTEDPSPSRPCPDMPVAQ